MKPHRIQRKRTKGWRMPKNAIYVGRPTVWGNPFTAHDKEWGGDKMEPRTLVLLYEILMKEMFKGDPTFKGESLLAEFLKPLRGKNLACWCPLNRPCHADVLLRMANLP